MIVRLIPGAGVIWLAFAIGLVWTAVRAVPVGLVIGLSGPSSAEDR